MESLTKSSNKPSQALTTFKLQSFLNTNLISYKLPFIYQCKWAVNQFFELILFSECALSFTEFIKLEAIILLKAKCMHSQTTEKKKKRQRSFPLLWYLKIFCWAAGERCQMVSPASWSDHMLPITAEGHAAGQQLNVGYQHGTYLVMG